MSTKNLTVMGLSVLLAAPAIALADAITYEDPNIDGTASIELKITDGNDREVKKVIAKKLAYPSGPPCGSSGRTGRVEVRGDWRVKGNGEFRVVGQFDGDGDTLMAGQLNVVGDVGRHKVTGSVKFTYGKTGCSTDKVNFIATD